MDWNKKTLPIRKKSKKLHSSCVFKDLNREVFRPTLQDYRHIQKHQVNVCQNKTDDPIYVPSKNE
jgi:hypothetical protein